LLEPELGTDFGPFGELVERDLADHVISALTIAHLRCERDGLLVADLAGIDVVWWSQLWAF